MRTDITIKFYVRLLLLHPYLSELSTPSLLGYKLVVQLIQLI